MKDIPGYEGLYSVTREGRVWSHPKTTLVGSNGGLRKDGGRWLNPIRVTQRTAHQRVYLSAKGKTFGLLIHRAVALAYLPNQQGLPHINHKDGDPTNNHVNNLEWCDAAANARHAVASGLTKMPKQTGAENSQSKLTETAVREMRTAHASGENCAAIARRLSLNPKTVWDIVHRKRWAHID